MSRTAKALSFLEESIRPAVDLVFPPRCPCCGEGIGRQSGLCVGCWAELAIPGDPSCSLCQRPFGDGGPGEGSICAPCLKEAPVHAGIAAGTLYNDTSRKLVLAFKHGGRIALAPMLARMIAARMPDAERSRLIVPVPLHRWRLWRRGYNQAVLLARELERLGHGTLLCDALLRTKATPSLGGLGSKARVKALAGSISVSPAAARLIDGREVVLVDDVLTSGATSTACVKALRRAGAASVRIACFSRVLNESLDAAN